MKAMTISGWKVFTILACISATMCVVQAQAPTFVTCQNYLTPAAGVPLPLAVDFTLPTAEDSDGNTVEVFCSHQPGDRFPLGKTEVTCNATVGSDKSTCKFEVGVGDATNCTRGYKACTCISAIDRCTCKIGYSGVDCGVEDGTNCIDGNTPSPGCGPSTCFIPACRCDNGWQGPSCDVVDDGSSCYVGGPPHCFACFAGDDPPCVCELGYQGKECEKDYLPPAFLFCPADFFVQAADDEDSAKASWNDPTAEDNSGVAPTISCDHISGSRFTAGSTRVTCTASDGENNMSHCTFNITVSDEKIPNITCPGNGVWNVDAESAFATVVLSPAPKAVDNIDGLVVVTCFGNLKPIGLPEDQYPVGETFVKCYANDSSANQASCSFTVTVLACDPCQNGGHSQDPDTCVCQCPGGFTGPLCSECKECVNGGNQDEATCVCNCFNSFQGPLCDVCPSDMQCGNGGEFDETSCKCNCRSPWTGPTCTECTPCANDGSNQDPDTCICDCPGVYLPPVCAECGGVTVCQNDGVFSDVFCNCTCLSPFEGKTCTECEPCQNGGSYQNKFTCVCDCPYFHTDPLCTVCPLEFVCLNGATRQEAACSCECADGWRGTDCSEPIPNIPDDEYPVSPIWTVSVEKKVSFEIAVIAPVGSGMECDPSINKFSNACNALVLEFKLSVEIEYKFVAGFSRVVIDQDKLRAGSVVVPHDVMYNYDEMTPTTRGISANALYEATVGKAVDRGYIGKLKVATGCQDCMAPQDKTYICDADPPECAAGLVLTQSTNGGVGTCYYVCWSKCKVDPTNCGDGTCHQESGSEKITCNCPQSSEVMYSGTQCQLQVQLVWLYVGVSLGGVLLLVLIIVLSVCLWRRRGKVHKFQDEDEEKEELHRPVSGKVIKELRSYHNDGNNRDMFFQEAATIPSHASPYAQVHKSRSSKAIKHGEANGAWKHGEANGAWPGALPRARARPLSEGQKDETKIKSSDFNGNEGGDRRSWYFWGSMSLPKKQPTEMIRMTSESGRF